MFFQRHWKVIKDIDSSYRPKMESLWDTHHICDPLQVSSQETNGNNITYLINIINETMPITSVPMCSPNSLLPPGYWGKLFFQPFAAGWDHMMSSGQENVYRSGRSVRWSPHTHHFLPVVFPQWLHWRWQHLRIVGAGFLNHRVKESHLTNNIHVEFCEWEENVFVLIHVLEDCSLQHLLLFTLTNIVKTH